MKHKKKIKRLEKRIEAWNAQNNKQGTKKPGSVKKG